MSLHRPPGQSVFLFIADGDPLATLYSLFVTSLLQNSRCRAYHHLMRTGAIIFAFVLMLGCYLGFRAKLNARTAGLPRGETAELEDCNARAPAKIDFATQIRPIFDAGCQPCHFSGGTMYQQLPFDRPETIRTLGTKLFTRIKDEEKRRLIREFLSNE